MEIGSRQLVPFAAVSHLGRLAAQLSALVRPATLSIQTGQESMVFADSKSSPGSSRKTRNRKVHVNILILKLQWTFNFRANFLYYMTNTMYTMFCLQVLILISSLGLGLNLKYSFIGLGVRIKLRYVRPSTFPQVCFYFRIVLTTMQTPNTKPSKIKRFLAHATSFCNRTSKHA